MAKRLSEDEKNKIIYMYTSGKGVTEIAKHLGRADCTISNFVHGIGLVAPEKDVPKIKRHRDYTPYSCDGCMYRERVWNTTICGFLDMTGEKRACSIENCTRYQRQGKEKISRGWDSDEFFI